VTNLKALSAIISNLLVEIIAIQRGRGLAKTDAVVRKISNAGKIA
jgi:hypothetical protein